MCTGTTESASQGKDERKAREPSTSEASRDRRGNIYHGNPLLPSHWQVNQAAAQKLKMHFKS